MDGWMDGWMEVIKLTSKKVTAKCAIFQSSVSGVLISGGRQTYAYLPSLRRYFKITGDLLIARPAS